MDGQAALVQRTTVCWLVEGKKIYMHFAYRTCANAKRSFITTCCCCAILAATAIAAAAAIIIIVAVALTIRGRDG